MILEYIVQNEEKTVNQIIKEKFELSNRLFNKLIKNKNVYVNGKNIDTRLNAKSGDRITIDLNYLEKNDNIISKKMDLDILYEDEGILALNKPAGIAIHPSISHFYDSLASGVKYYFEKNGINKKIRPINRLDLGTSGVVLFAKNEYIQENLIRQMNAKTFSKKYIAIVTGVLEQDKGIIDAPIARKHESIIERCVAEHGQIAITEYEVLQRFEDFCIVKCNLITGRTHQIRVHLAYIGHPLLGDTLYGTASDLIKRQALHCYKVSFLHPITSKNMQICAEIPEDMKFFKNGEVFLDPFYSENNLKALEKSKIQLEKGNVIIKTMNELEAMENE